MWDKFTDPRIKANAKNLDAGRGRELVRSIYSPDYLELRVEGRPRGLLPDGLAQKNQTASNDGDLLGKTKEQQFHSKTCNGMHDREKVEAKTES